MSFPTVDVDVSFSTGPLDTPSWESIAGAVRGVSTVTGRDDRFQSYDPGTATLVLNNRARRFDPLHAGGPHFGQLVPGKRVRVRATYDGTTYDVFTGFVDGWPQSYAPPSESVATVSATDGFKQLGRARLPVDVYGTVVASDAPIMWYRLNEKLGKKLADSSGNSKHLDTTIDISNVAADGLLASPDGGVDLDLGFEAQIPRAHFGGDLDPGSIEFWFLADKDTTGNIVGQSFFVGDGTNFLVAISGGSVVAVVSETVTPALKIVSTGNHKVCDGVPHHIVVTRSGTTITIYVDGTARSSTLVGGSPASGVDMYDQAVNNSEAETFLGWEDSPAKLDELAFYDTALSSSDIAAHLAAGSVPWDGDLSGARIERILDLIGWPAADRDIDNGQARLGPAVWDADQKALPLLQLIESTEQGALYIDHRDGGKLRFRGRHAVLADAVSTTSQATFTDELADTTNVHYSGIEIEYDDTEVVNSVSVSWAGGDVTVTDQTSIDAYGEQTMSVDTLLPTQAAAELLGSWILTRLKDPKVRIRSITINATGRSGTAADATWEQVLGRKFGDRITVIRHPQTEGDPIETDVIIDGIDHQIENGVNTWTTTFRCSPAETVSYWILGTSELGTDTRLAA